MQGVHIGLSGYAYKPWQGEGKFYPPELKQREYLPYYCGRYGVVEIDSTWYRMPASAMIDNFTASPPEFKICFKAHRKITHLARLKLEGIDSLQFQLVCQSPLAPQGRLGPMLVQLPPNFKLNLSRLEEFLIAAPKKFSELPKFEREDSVKEAPAGLAGSEYDPIRYNFEFRHETWNNEEAFALLESHGAGWVCSDTDETDAVRKAVGQTCYCRLRKSDYPIDMLEGWASLLRQWTDEGRESFVFLKHEDEGYPWVWADELCEMLK